MLVALYTRGLTHFSGDDSGGGILTPACRSRAQVEGFHLNKHDNLSIHGAPCQKCVELLGLAFEPADGEGE